MATAAGWYPDKRVEGQKRYWDGEAWTAHTAPASGPPAAAVARVDREVRDAQRVARAIGTIKWVLIWVALIAAVASVTVYLAMDAGTTSLIASMGVILSTAVAVLLVWVTLGWAEHVLAMLAKIATTTSRGSGS